MFRRLNNTQTNLSCNCTYSFKEKFIPDSPDIYAGHYPRNEIIRSPEQLFELYNDIHAQYGEVAGNENITHIFHGSLNGIINGIAIDNLEVNSLKEFRRFVFEHQQAPTKDIKPGLGFLVPSF
jgi:hypothetical protein